MKDTIFFIVTTLILIFSLYLIQQSGKDIERKEWCDKYNDRTEFKECMKEGAKYDDSSKL